MMPMFVFNSPPSGPFKGGGVDNTKASKKQRKPFPKHLLIPATILLVFVGFIIWTLTK